MTSDSPQQYLRHLHGPTLDGDGLLVGEIELPGGLPPDDEDDQQPSDRDTDDSARHRDDGAVTAADGGTQVRFERAPGGFRVVTPAQSSGHAPHGTAQTGEPSTAEAASRDASAGDRERSLETAQRHEVLRDPPWWASDEGSARYERWALHGTDPDTAGPAVPRSELAQREAGPGATWADGAAVDPRVPADGKPWVDSPEAVAERERWAIEHADPANALDDTHPDDPERLAQRLDDLRARLAGYTWRESIDHDQALAGRRAQLGRWHDDDHTGDHTGEYAGTRDDGDVAEDSGYLPNSLAYPEDPGWYR